MDDTNYIVGDFTLDHTPFTLSDDTRSRHIYVPGQTGVGKSTLLFNFAIWDYERPRGFIFIDPHGDNAQRIAASAPQNRIEDTIYFDPLDDQPPCFNPIIELPPLRRYTYASDIALSLSHIWPEGWGARMDRIILHSILLLLNNIHEQHSMADIP